MSIWNVYVLYVEFVWNIVPVFASTLLVRLGSLTWHRETSSLPAISVYDIVKKTKGVGGYNE